MNIEQARQLAKNESTSQEKLRELASSNDSITRQNVVTNPNVPPDVLLKLANQFPRQVFNNSAIDLLLLETPDLFSGTSADALCSLLKREVPHRMIEYAANSTDERVKLAVLMNSRTLQDILEELDKSQNNQVAEAARLHINYSKNNLSNNHEAFIQVNIQQKLIQADQNYQEILGMINNFIKLYDHIPNCISHYLRGGILYIKDYSHLSLSEIETLADSGKWQELQFLAKNPNLPISILERIFANGNAYIYLAENPNLPVKLIRKLLDHPNFLKDIGKRIGLNPSTPVEILEELAKSDRHNAVYEAIALNPKTPNSILEILLNKPRMMGYVYEALGRNQNISVTLLEKLVALSQEAYIPVFNNPKTPEQLKAKLLKYFENKKILPISRYYPQEFIKNISISSEFLAKFIPWENCKLEISFPEILSFHPNLSPESLQYLLNSEKRMIRQNAIFNSKTPQYITEVWGMSFLETLNPDELKIIASSFYITEELLKELVNHKALAVSRTAASNPYASNQILEDWETSPFYKDGALEQIMAEEQRLLDRWESSISESNRLTVLLNSETPIPVLAQISRSSSWLERYAIAQNPNTPLGIIQQLTNDGNKIVRATAKNNLESKQKVSS